MVVVILFEAPAVTMLFAPWTKIHTAGKAALAEVGLVLAGGQVPRSAFIERIAYPFCPSLAYPQLRPGAVASAPRRAEFVLFVAASP